MLEHFENIPPTTIVWNTLRLSCIYSANLTVIDDNAEFYFRLGLCVALYLSSPPWETSAFHKIHKAAEYKMCWLK